MANQRRGGIIQIQVNGTVIEVAGAWSYNLGLPTREALLGHDTAAGGNYKEMPKTAFMEGDIRDSDELDVAALRTITGATITLKVANGKSIVLRKAYAAGDWDQGTEEGTIAARFEGASPAEEIKP